MAGPRAPVPDFRLTEAVIRGAYFVTFGFAARPSALSNATTASDGTVSPAR